MKEIDRIVKQVADAYDFNEVDQRIIREAIIKGAFAAILDNALALQICAHVERKDKNERSKK